jgi:hypothetical protein
MLDFLNVGVALCALVIAIASGIPCAPIAPAARRSDSAPARSDSGPAARSDSPATASAARTPARTRQPGGPVGLRAARAATASPAARIPAARRSDSAPNCAGGPARPARPDSGPAVGLRADSPAAR